MERFTDPGKFSEMKFRNAKAKNSAYKIYDGGGLYLLVSKKETKTWKFKYRFEGRERCATIGRYRENHVGVSLVEARHIARMAKDLVRRSIDPKVHINNRGFYTEQSDFETVAKQWHDNETGSWKNSYAESVWRSLERDVLPTFGKCQVSEITSQLCRSLLLSIEERGAIETCKKIKRRLVGIFNYAITMSLIDKNPMDPLESFGKARKVKGHAVVKCEELSSFLSNLESTVSLEEVTKLGVEMTVHTFVRSYELRHAVWDEFDLKNKRWNIPGERMKRGLDHVVPISPHVEKLLLKLKAINGNRKYVFASSIKPEQPISSGTINAAIKRIGYEGTGHGFRKIASTSMNENKFHGPAIERQLSHVSKKKVEAVYNKAQYFADRVEIMNWWSAHLLDIRAGRTKPVEYKIV
tara:strand:- start:4635 stop:5864 length:1230 start_codon:yes stop_codon:yes gene_type:complete